MIDMERLTVLDSPVLDQLGLLFGAHSKTENHGGHLWQVRSLHSWEARRRNKDLERKCLSSTWKALGSSPSNEGRKKDETKRMGRMGRKSEGRGGGREGGKKEKQSPLE